MKQTNKYLLFIAAIALCMASFGQVATKDVNGNYVAVKVDKNATASKSTGKSFTDSKGVKYPLFESAKGKLYYLRTSKAGNVYKAYLKVQ